MGEEKCSCGQHHCCHDNFTTQVIESVECGKEIKFERKTCLCGKWLGDKIIG